MKAARDEAMADAQSKAQQLADKGGVKLGSPTYISENSYTPYQPIPMAMDSKSAAGASTPVSAGRTGHNRQRAGDLRYQVGHLLFDSEGGRANGRPPSCSSGRIRPGCRLLCPHPLPLQFSLDFGGFKQRLVTHVWWVGPGLCQSQPDQLQVDHGVADPYIPQQPVISISLRSILFEPDRFAIDQPAVGVGSFSRRVAGDSSPECQCRCNEGVPR